MAHVVKTGSGRIHGAHEEEASSSISSVEQTAHSADLTVGGYFAVPAIARVDGRGAPRA